jgi:hypothetical protein
VQRIKAAMTAADGKPTTDNIPEGAVTRLNGRGLEGRSRGQSSVIVTGRAQSGRGRSAAARASHGGPRFTKRGHRVTVLTGPLLA